MDIIEIIKVIVPALIGVIGCYFALKGAIETNRKEIADLTTSAEKRLDKLESQKEVDTKSFQDLIRSIDRLNFHFEKLEKTGK